MKRSNPPICTYRLQFNRDFTFSSALRITSYLHHLGVSHVYASPLLKARANSAHGYDIVDHNAINPELGSPAGFGAYVRSLHHHDMRLILDVVPNHMGVWFDDNAWWLDVLEHGEASPYASYFDIDWHPTTPFLRNKVLVPCLADHYGSVLEAGELQLRFDPAAGSFAVRYHQHLLPIDPRTYPKIVSAPGALSGPRTDGDRRALKRLQSVLGACRRLPRRTELAPAARRRRRQDAAACKAALAALCRHNPKIAELVRGQLQLCNGIPGKPGSFDRLHRLLESQAYRLSYWLVASDEINYRRFFDINDLAGIRMDHPEVFAATHGYIARMFANGQLDGLRIDHPDGLADPFGYFRDLQRLIARAAPARSDGKPTDGYVVVEKILAPGEHLPADWPVSGTTGYDVAQLINGLLIHPAAARPLQRIYGRFVGHSVSFEDVVYRSKKLVIRTILAGELTVLANRASRIAQTSRRTRDFTYLGLREAITEIVACFPVYRTYLTAVRSSDHDRRVLLWTIARAKKRSHAKDILIFDFLADLLNLRGLERHTARVRREILQFVLRFQQYTAPVVAKAVEDTAFYSYNLLVSLNDVGFDPRRFAVSCRTFHAENRQRLRDWPRGMVCTSTHDSKRSEDVRARLDVLSELPQEWREHLLVWRRLNRAKKRLVDDQLAPSPNDEYLLYQILLGTWPLQRPDENALSSYRDRIASYMLKAVREAKLHSSWINPNTDYEEATRQFVTTLLNDAAPNPFLDDFIGFQQRVARFGLLNALTQTLLKLTVPGIPDIYQGNEVWTFRLADPDNRCRVDHAARERALETLRRAPDGPGERRELLADLLLHIVDGRAKLYLTWRVLQLRQARPQLFADGDYQGLPVAGARAEHICAFARSHRAETVVVAAPRWFARLAAPGKGPLERETWIDTWVRCPRDAGGETYRDFLSGETLRVTRRDAHPWFSAADLFRHFPVALLYNH